MSACKTIVGLQGRKVILVAFDTARLETMEARRAQAKKVTYRTAATKDRVAPPPVQPIGEIEFQAREQVCRKCDQFREEFPVYRCLKKLPCTKLAIKHPQEICRRGLWVRAESGQQKQKAES